VLRRTHVDGADRLPLSAFYYLLDVVPTRRCFSRPQRRLGGRWHRRGSTAQKGLRGKRGGSRRNGNGLFAATLMRVNDGWKVAAVGPLFVAAGGARCGAGGHAPANWMRTSPGGVSCFI